MKLTIKQDDIEADLSYGQLAIGKEKRVFTITITHFFNRRM